MTGEGIYHPLATKARRHVVLAGEYVDLAFEHLDACVDIFGVVAPETVEAKHKAREALDAQHDAVMLEIKALVAVYQGRSAPV